MLITLSSCIFFKNYEHSNIASIEMRCKVPKGKNPFSEEFLVVITEKTLTINDHKIELNDSHSRYVKDKLLDYNYSNLKSLYYLDNIFGKDLKDNYHIKLNLDNGNSKFITGSLYYPMFVRKIFNVSCIFPYEYKPMIFMPFPWKYSYSEGLEDIDSEMIHFED